MVAWSAPPPQRFRVAGRAPCAALHPWTDSCAGNALGIAASSFKGSTNFFLPLYLGIRRLRGAHSEASTGLLPGLVGGAGIFLEHPSRRRVDTTLFIGLVTDLYVKILVSSGIIKMNLWKELVVFSSSSTLLLYCLRAFPLSMTTMWPFLPHKLNPDPEKRGCCPHSGGCLDSVSTAGKTYFCYGILLQIIKVVVVNFHRLFSKPVLFFKAFLKLDNLRLPLFSGLYISIFKGISCLLVRRRGQDEAWHSLPAAGLASLCYLVMPNFTLALVAFGNLCQIVCRKYKDDLKLPEYPWEEIIFMICMGLLYHARAVYPHCFPSYMFKIMDTVTDGRAQDVYGLVEKHLVMRY